MDYFVVGDWKNWVMILDEFFVAGEVTTFSGENNLNFCVFLYKNPHEIS